MENLRLPHKVAMDEVIPVSGGGTVDLTQINQDILAHYNKQ
jgi:hypothetical protein